MQIWRDQERDDFSNGVLRSTYKTYIRECEEHTFSANVWHSKIAVVSNVGILMFNKENVKEKPELIPWSDTFTLQIKNQSEVLDGKTNLIVIGIDGEEKTYSLPKHEYLKQFCDKANMMRLEVKASKNPLAGYPKN